MAPTFYGGPFNMPTGVAFASNGDVYVSDGYGNRRVHRFSATGELLHSWGMAGDGPGQFALVHFIAIDEHDQVWIADRDNHRIQVFGTEERPHRVEGVPHAERPGVRAGPHLCGRGGRAVDLDAAAQAGGALPGWCMEILILRHRILGCMPKKASTCTIIQDTRVEFLPVIISELVTDSHNSKEIVLSLAQLASGVFPSQHLPKGRVQYSLP